MRVFSRYISVSMIGLLLISSQAMAAPLESMSHLNELAKAFVEKNTSLLPGDRLEVHLSQAANELKLAQCHGEINVSLPENTTSETPNTLNMKCTGPEAWQVYVPISTQIFTKVIVAKQPIPTNETIDDPMLTTAEVDKNQLYSGYYKDMSEVVGQVALANLPEGTVLNKRNTQRPILIHRNQNVSIIATHGAIMVKAEGIAKTDGALQDTIKVFNPSSKRYIDGIVMSGSTVEAL